VLDERDISDKFDYVFWFGDLNYRVNTSRSHANQLIKLENIDVLFISID